MNARILVRLDLGAEEIARSLEQLLCTLAALAQNELVERAGDAHEQSGEESLHCERGYIFFSNFAGHTDGDRQVLGKV